MDTGAQAVRQNRMLAAMPANEYRELLGKLESVSLPLGQVLNEQGSRIRYVYFPQNCLISLVAMAKGSSGLEVGMVGAQSLCGVSLALGASASPARAIVQGAGTAMRMTAAAFAAQLKRSQWFSREALRQANAVMATSMQIAACNNTHVLRARFARWLLMTSDCL